MTQNEILFEKNLDGVTVQLRHKEDQYQFVIKKPKDKNTYEVGVYDAQTDVYNPLSGSSLFNFLDVCQRGNSFYCLLHNASKIQLDVYTFVNKEEYKYKSYPLDELNLISIANGGKPSYIGQLKIMDGKVYIYAYGKQIQTIENLFVIDQSETLSKISFENTQTMVVEEGKTIPKRIDYWEDPQLHAIVAIDLENKGNDSTIGNYLADVLSADVDSVKYMGYMYDSKNLRGVLYDGIRDGIVYFFYKTNQSPNMHILRFNIDDTIQEWYISDVREELLNSDSFIVK